MTRLCNLMLYCTVASLFTSLDLQREPSAIFIQKQRFARTLTYIKSMLVKMSTWAIAKNSLPPLFKNSGFPFSGYGMAKAAVHHLVSSFAAPKSGLPTGAACLAILPVTLDTPMNRKWMPKADTSTWTPLDFVADLFVNWTSDSAKRPASGALVQLVTKGGNTELVI